MKNSKKLISLLLVLLLAITLVACGDKEVVEDTNEEVVNEKPYEGTVLEVSVAYGGADASFEAFTQETGIEIEWVSMSTGAKLSQLQAEDGKTTTDIWFGGGVDSYINAREIGRASCRERV